MVPESEQEIFKQHRPNAYSIWIVLHEIFGHGTGKLLSEISPGNFNFDPNDPPSIYITGDPVKNPGRPGPKYLKTFQRL
jgi:dipeptidyl-peptidase-3